MAQPQAPYSAVQTCAQLDPQWICLNITSDSKSTYGAFHQKGVMRWFPGAPPSWVDLGPELAGAVKSAAASPDGVMLYVDKRHDGLWEHTLGSGPCSNKQLLKHDVQGLGEIKGNANMPHTMLCTGPHLYFWRVKEERLHLHRLHTASRQVQLAYKGGRAEGDMWPSWALDTSAGVMYFKPDSKQNTVLRVELREGQTAEQPSATLELPEELEGTAYLSNCTAGDGSLLVCALDQRKVFLWHPPSAVSGQGTNSAGRLQLLAGGGAGCPDSVGDGPCKLFGPQSAISLDAKGHLWLFDWAAEGSSVRCIFSFLHPPAHLAAPLSRAGLWVVGDAACMHSSSGLGSDWCQLLASGEGADVVLVAAGGERLHAHSLVLRARCEWFRRRAASGMQEAAGAGAGHQQQGVDEVHVEEHPAAVVRALLSFLYTGCVQLGAPAEGVGLEGAETSTSSAPAATACGGTNGDHGRCSKRQRVDNEAGQQVEGTLDAAASVAAAAAAPEPPYLLLAQLLHAASVFQVPQLHAACLQVACARVDVHCALPWLVYGHEHGEAELKQLALGYAGAHYAEIRSLQPAAVEGLRRVEGELVLELMHAALDASARTR